MCNTDFIYLICWSDFPVQVAIYLLQAIYLDGFYLLKIDITKLKEFVTLQGKPSNPLVQAKNKLGISITEKKLAFKLERQRRLAKSKIKMAIRKKKKIDIEDINKLNEADFEQIKADGVEYFNTLTRQRILRRGIGLRL